MHAPARARALRPTVVLDGFFRRRHHGPDPDAHAQAAGAPVATAQGGRARAEPVAEAEAMSGRTVEEVAPEVAPRQRTKPPAMARPAARPKRRTTQKAGRIPSLDRLHPQLATLSASPPTGAGYVYEMKYDGYRALARIVDGRAELRSRNGLDWTRAFPRITAALEALPVDDAVIDGEICAVDAGGRTSFQALQNVMGTRGHRKVAADDAALVYFVFDLLFLDGTDFRGRGLLERKENLKGRFQKTGKGPLLYSDHLSGDGRVILAQACQLGLEGVVAKQIDAPYESTRTRNWLKLKCNRRQEFVIVGYVKAEGARQGFRSLLLALREKDGLRYAGKVGTGFSDASLRDIAAEMKRHVRATSPLEHPPREPNVVWLEPTLVCEVEYTEMTRDGSLRHPSFQGLRRDKPAREVRREKAVPPPASRPRRGAKAKAPSVEVSISHPERVMDQRSGITKGDLAQYYARVADRFLPFAVDRPIALVRCPQGDSHQCFFQKHAMAGLPADVKRGRAAGQEMLYVQDARGLLQLVQFNVIEFHGWGARMPAMAKPDWIVFDLDPDESLKFDAVVEAAYEVRDALARIDLESFVKTTGGKGLHVVVPIRPKAGWDEVKEFSRTIAQALADQCPERYVATMSKAKRRGRIFVDYLRNGEGATAILPYSVRARPGATVAVPVAWKDLGRVDPREFRVENAAQWLGRRRKDPWTDLLSLQQELPHLKA
jgi:bifunctional non-homologous end joining protein LigD